MTQTLNQTVSLLFAALLASSMVAGVAVLGTQSFDTDQHGTAAAQSITPSDILVAGGDFVRVLDQSDGSTLWNETLHSSQVEAVALSGSERLIATGDDSGTVKVTYASNATVKWSNSSHSAAATDIEFIDDGAAIAVSFADGAVMRLAASDGAATWARSQSVDTSPAVNTALDASASRVLVGYNIETGGHKVEILGADDGAAQWNQTYTGSFRDVAFSPFGQRFAVAGGSTTADTRIHDTESKDVSWTVSNDPLALTFARSGNHLYHSAGLSFLEKHAADDGGEVWQSNDHSSDMRHISSPNDEAVYTLTTDSSIRRLDADSGSSDWTATQGSGSVTQVAAGDEPLESVFGSATAIQTGDPVQNATVYAMGVNTSAATQIGNRSLDDIIENPVPPSWQNQLDNLAGFNTDGFAPDESGIEDERVFLHSEADWEADDIPDHFVIQNQIFDGTPPTDVQPRASIDEDGEALFTCWAPDDGLIPADDIDSSIPGFETTNCGNNDIVINRVDPLNATVSSRTVTPQPLYDVWSFSNLGSKTHYVAGADLEPGMYSVHPEGSPEAAMTYAVAPDGDVSSLRDTLENYASDEFDANTEFEQEVQNAIENDGAEVARTTTDSNGEYELTFSNENVETVQLRAIKGGGALPDNPQDLTLSSLRSEYESEVRSHFDAEPKIGPDSLQEYKNSEGRSAFRDVCRNMESVVDDVGESYYGQTSTAVPNANADIEGRRLVPEGTDPLVAECAEVNFAEAIANDPLSLLPGFAGDLAEYARGELDEVYETILSFVDVNDTIRETVENAIDGDLPENPNDLTRDAIEDAIDGGLSGIDSPGEDTDVGDGGDGGFVPSLPGGDDPPSVEDPEEVADRVNETISRTWPVGNVGDITGDDVGVLIRLVFSDGTETVLGPDSEHVSLEEGTLTDEVRLEEYPFNSNASVARISLDVATENGVGSDEGTARNPTFDGTISGLDSIRVSNTAPGPSDPVSVGVTPAEPSQFGALQNVTVSGPDCERAVQPTDGEAQFETCGAGQHRVSITFDNAENDAFTEVIHIDAKPTSQSRPASLRAAAGPTGRHLIVANGMQEGHLEVSDGASDVTIVGVIPADQEIPNRIKASTTGVDVARGATHDIELRQGDTEQTIRERVGMVLHVDQLDNESLLERNGRPIRNPGRTSSATVTHYNQSTSIDSFSSDTASMSIDVNRDPGYVDRALHWVGLRFPSVPLGQAAPGAEVLA